MLKNKQTSNIGKLLAGLSNVLGCNYNDEGLLLIKAKLQKYTYEQIETAILTIAEKETKRPENIINLIMQYIEGKDSDIASQQALLVLELVDKSYQRYNPVCRSWTKPKLDDPITAYVFETRWRDWNAFCKKMTDEDGAKMWFIKEFKELYIATQKNMQRQKTSIAIDKKNDKPQIEYQNEDMIKADVSTIISMKSL